MSVRSLIELNHDLADRMGDPAFLVVLENYLRSTSDENAMALSRFGARVLSERHHSSAYHMRGEPDGFPVRHIPDTKKPATGLG